MHENAVSAVHDDGCEHKTRGFSFRLSSALHLVCGCFQCRACRASGCECQDMLWCTTCFLIQEYCLLFDEVPQRTGNRYIVSTAACTECGSTLDGTKCVRNSLPINVAMTLCTSAGIRACTSVLRVTSAFSSGARSNSAALQHTEGSPHYGRNWLKVLRGCISVVLQLVVSRSTFIRSCMNDRAGALPTI